MSSIALPANFKPYSTNLNLSVTQRVNAAPFGGSEQAVDLLNDRWLLSCELPALTADGGGALEAFIGSLRGQVNTSPLWHFARPIPRGTMRGTLTMSSTAAQGASSIVVTGGAGQAGTTLLAGDMLGVGGLLVMVSADCVANGSGVITVPITSRLRAQQTSGAALTWNKPTAEFRLLSTSGIQYSPAVYQSVSFDFAEKI